MWLSLCPHDASDYQFMRNIIEDFVTSSVHFMFNFRNAGQFFRGDDIFTCTVLSNGIRAALPESAERPIAAGPDSTPDTQQGSQRGEGRGFA